MKHVFLHAQAGPVAEVERSGAPSDKPSCKEQGKKKKKKKGKKKAHLSPQVLS